MCQEKSRLLIWWSFLFGLDLIGESKAFKRREGGSEDIYLCKGRESGEKGYRSPVDSPLILNNQIIRLLGFDPVWFGILMLINLEMGMTTPPFGVMLFVMKGVAPPDITIKDICYAALPFILCDMVAMIMIIIWPQLALWLPSLTH